MSPSRFPAFTVSALLVLTLLAAPASAQAPDWAILRRAIRAEMAENRIPGAAVAIVSHDRVLFLEGLGVAETGTGRPVSPATCFRIGSLTKTLTATALAALAVRGRIDLDRRVGSYIQGLPGRLGAPTLAQLLSHRGGLVDRVEFDGLAEEPAAAAFAGSFRAGDTFTAPGRVFSYSSLGYALAGRAAAATEGLSFAGMMRREIFEPVGMTAAGYDVPGACPDQATGYVYRGGRLGEADIIRNAVLRPAGLISANAADLARFARLLLGRGSLDGRRLVPAEAIALIETAHAPIPGEGRSYGYGLFIAESDGRQVLTHNGDELGTSSSLTLVPADDVAVVVLTNAPGRLRNSVEMALRFVTGRAVSVGLPEAGAQLPLVPADFDQLPGDYGRFRIYRAGGELLIAPKVPFFMRLSELGRRIVRYGGDNYAFIPEQSGRPPTRFAVVRGPGGRPDYLFLRGRAFRRQDR